MPTKPQAEPKKSREPIDAFLKLIVGKVEIPEQIRKELSMEIRSLIKKRLAAYPGLFK